MAPWFAVASAVLLSSLLMFNYIDFVLVLLPKYADAYLLRAIYSRDKTNGVDEVRMPFVTRLIPQNITQDNVEDLLNPSGFPLHVKNFVSPDHDKLVTMLTESNKGKDMRMLDYSAAAGRTGNHFSPSCTHGGLNTQNVPFDEFSTNHLFPEKASNHSWLYAGFEAITDPTTIRDILGVEIEELGDYRQNNLFTSNFPEEILSAAMHCAPIDSLTFQLIGTKTWYLVSPEDLAALKSIPMPTAFNLPMTDDELLSKIKNIHIVKQGPGDAFYFGPHWCHAVSTEAGPNIMFNMRYNAREKLKKYAPTSLLLKLMYRHFTRAIGKNPQDNAVNNYPLIFEDLNSWFSDCGPSEAFDKLFDYVKALPH